MDFFIVNVADACHQLCKLNKPCAAELQGLLSKQIWNANDRKKLLDTLAKCFLQPNSTLDICQAFRTVLLDIVHRTSKEVEPNGKLNWLLYQQFCVALSKAMEISPDVVQFCSGYFQAKPCFFVERDGEPVAKKQKKCKESKVTRMDLVHAVWVFLCHTKKDILHLWDWSPLLQFLNDKNKDVRWVSIQCIGLLTGMTTRQIQTVALKYLTEEEVRGMTIRYDKTLATSKRKALMLCNLQQPETDPSQRLTHTIKSIVDEDLNEDVVSVCGILLPKLCDTEPDTTPLVFPDIVPAASTQRNLRSLALAVASGSPVLLQGPVGSGKTALVEYLAKLTGRTKPQQIMKVQLGDQTDSKTLLGTYKCTDIPGEFVWQPGTLTCAVTEGQWLLLEDIDYAPMDVISILLPILESRTLSIPGHGDAIQAAPGFQLFVTQRLLGTSEGWYKQHGSNAGILEKLWSTVMVEPLSRNELEKVIVTKYPKFSTVVNRLLDVYFMVSAGRHELSGDSMEVESVGQFLSHDGRLISTRDLMKWCERISLDFDVSALATSNAVFQEAMDCFCACLPKPEKRLNAAEAIGVKLNITKAKAEYQCVKYKPSVSLETTQITIGRRILPRKNINALTMVQTESVNFAYTRQASLLLERIAVCVGNNEPVLLVGETGTGKTSTVQYLAHQLGHRLKVINMNQQSDSTDLLGGFKPMDLKHVISPVREDFEILFTHCFSRKQNLTFLGHLQECFAKRRWSDLVKLLEHPTQIAVKKYNEDPVLRKSWKKIQKRLQQLKLQAKHADSALAFSFIEGTLVKAMKAGDWVLLDEINLSTAETLECLGGLLESSSGSLLLMERGDREPLIRHKDFRLFACMNPATDVGKKDLPPGIRNRFTEIYVDEVDDDSDLRILVADYLKGLSLTARQIDGIIKFYQIIRNEAVKKLVDGTGHRPHYSLRTLCRALRQAASNLYGNVSRSLYEGFCFSFLTQLDRSSHPVVEQLVCQHVVGKQNIKGILKQPLPEPPGGKYVKFEGYWIHQGTKEPHVNESYVLTPSVRANLRDLARVVSTGKHPVLIQGETSVGKTSLIKWLADASGNNCVRVNNHEHTDLQEYVGCYAADEHGKLLFKEGVLVDAMRKGHWVILDELNLAPTDVLEALNRLLDDNRELFIPETQQTVKAHPHFMLFATQNPPGLYGGRKVLSRAFRNRFVELHFDELPSGELELILHQRCQMPMSYCKKLVAVMLELQTIRRTSSVFAGKQGFITLRDLFRWAERYTKASIASTATFYDWDQYMADSGYMLLAGRVRKAEESQVIETVLHKYLKRKVNPTVLFSAAETGRDYVKELMAGLMSTAQDEFEHIVWTHNMKRLAILVGQALKFGEPVLLIGDTGCGKTTMCQLLAARAGLNLYSINCHLHTESADFLGGLRPVRNRESKEDEQRLFEWCDGPLVTAMKEGAMILIDEISLADDSVLERLNSVLEPERRLLLAEKGGGDGKQNDVEEITAAESFQILATMNPGGDYGKKELSPALRNRFTEIWCPQSQDHDDLIKIIEHNLKSGIHLVNQQDGSSGIGRAIMEFVQWFSNNDLGKRCTVSIRDLLSWVNFINTCSKTIEDDMAMETDTSCPKLDPAVAYIHGAYLVFIDSLGSGLTSATHSQTTDETRTACMKFLINQLQRMTHTTLDASKLYITSTNQELVDNAMHFGILPFFIQRGPNSTTVPTDYAVNAPTTSKNLQRLMRGLQLHRPLLLEGSPGVGKTSLVGALAKASGHELVRINLSDQTDVSDLFGADLPVEGGEGGQFAWRDGPLLKALKAGHWIVLDELNLASQSVLEGLNACLDHRAEVYVPELGKTFHVNHEKTRLFACQNPLNQGGGRKGLPRSFLNRFTQVYVEPLSREDLLFITTSIYAQLPTDVLAKMVDFNMKMYEETMVTCQWGQRGGPWEFNLRDIFRWCDLLVKNQSMDTVSPGEYVGLIYTDRMRTAADKQKVFELYQEVFGPAYPLSRPTGYTQITTKSVQVGHSVLERDESTPAQTNPRSNLQLLHHDLQPLESIMKCIQMNWMTILVGCSASGKSSFIHSLAQLLNRKLHVLAMNSSMDTTELLGGFEQADIGRHISNVCSKVESIALSTARQLIQTQHATSASSILKAWSQMKQELQNVKSGSTLEEVETLRERLAKCGQLIYTVQDTIKRYDMPIEDSVTKLQERVHALKEKIDSKGYKAGGGGQFEWVDSLLVEALNNGDWLLIDNVNFCSPSVLDRLNALLEPNGILTINERGVIDGEIPSVKPHPDFRLFLAMDPRHGEISRAMRNRGIEICILGEGEDSGYDHHDIQLMLHSLGYVGTLPCNMLLHLQKELQGLGRVGESYTVVDLLHVGRLVVQQLERGVCLQSAMLNACNDVYVKRQKDVTRRQEVREIVESHIVHLDTMKYESDHEQSALLGAGLWPDPVPSISDWSADPTLATIRQQSSPLLHLVNEYLLQAGAQTQVPLTFATLSGSKYDLPKPESGALDDLKKSLKYAAEVVFEHASSQDWSVRLEWLQMTLKKRVTPESMGFLQPMLHSIERGLKVLFDGPWSKTLTALQEVDVELGDCPLDVRWNPYMRRKFGESHPKSLDEMEKLLNQVYLLHTLHQNTMEDVNVKKHKNMSFIELSAAVQQGLLPPSSLPNPVLVHLYPFLQTLDEDLTNLVSETPLALTNDDLQHLLLALAWKNHLVAVCGMPVKGRGAAQPMMAELALHWNWLMNKTIREFFNNSRPSPKLQSIASHLQEVFGTDNQASKLHQRFWTSYGHPRGFTSQEMADLILQGEELSEAIRVETAALAHYLKGEGRQVRRNLLDAIIGAMEKADHDFLHNKLEDIASVLSSAGFYRPQPGDATKPPPPLCLLSSLPLLSYLSLLQEKAVMLQVLQGGAEGSVQKYLMYCLGHDVTSVGQLAPYQVLLNGSEEDSTWDIFPSLLLHHIQHLYNSLYTSQLTDWIIWRNPQQEEDERNQVVTKGPGALQTSQLSYTVMGLLSSTDTQITSKDDPAGLGMTVPLGLARDKVQQFGELSKMLWSHSEMLSSEKISARSMDSQLLREVFNHLLHTLGSLLPQISTDSSVIQELQKSSLLPPSIIDLLSSCTTAMESLDVSSEAGLVQFGDLWARVGLIQVHLLSPTGPVDPVHKVAVKLRYVRSEISDIEKELEVRHWIWLLWTGKDLDDEAMSGQHPRLGHLISRRDVLKEKAERLEERIALRPEPSQFSSILQYVEQFLTTVCSIKSILSTLDKFNSAYQDLETIDTSAIQSLLVQETTWQATLEQYIKKMQTDYPLYRDMLVPYLAGVAQVGYGIKLVRQAVEKRLTYRQLCKELPALAGHQLEDVVSNLAKFPNIGKDSSTFLHTAEKLTSQLPSAVVTHVSLSNGLDITKLWKAALLHTKNHAVLSQHLDTATITILTLIFDYFYTSWKEAEVARKQKEEEKASLYKYKTVTHGDERSEEERELDDLRENFPVFEQEFVDIVNEDVLDSQAKPVSDDTVDAPEFAEAQLTPADMAVISSIHALLYTGLVKNSWLVPECVDGAAVNVVEPSLLGQQVAKTLVQNMLKHLDVSLDNDLLGSHLLASKAIQGSVEGGAKLPFSLYTRQKPYDVYHDANISEVMPCLPVLDQMMAKLKELLEQWPDHPTLKQLVTIIERIKSFSVTQPLMKFVTGLEVLLQKAQDWESLAARHVSLMSNLEEVTRLVINWRKLELKCWNRCLDMVAWRMEESASKWWFHLYELLSGFIHGKEEWAEDGERKLVDALKQFMEISPLGEFCIRLKLLYAFHCQLVHQDATPRQDVALRILWNIYQFYKQFKANVEKNIAKQRTPIERELKGFVKIAKWNDVNYWAVKQATEKTHRTLHKHIKQYQVILMQPVNRFFIDQEEKESEGEKGDKQAKVELKLYLTPKTMMETDLPPDAEGTSLTPGYFQKMRRLSQKIITKVPYPDLVESVDMFVGDVIEGVHELQASDVSQISDKDKQKSEAKLIHQRKRKGLADLFKALADLGLSYRKGVLASKDREDTSLIAMPPIDVQATLQQLGKQSCDADLVNLWPGCDHYFYKSVARKALLQSVMKSPSKELTLPMLERCRGFTQDLMDFTLRQRKAIAECVTPFSTLRLDLHELMSLKQEDTSTRPGIPPQAELHKMRVNGLMAPLMAQGQLINGRTTWNILEI